MIKGKFVMNRRKTYGSILSIAGVLSLILAVITLLNITAPNPTGRRYSSGMPEFSGGTTTIGTSAEVILSNDLGVPRNEETDQRQCFCPTGDNGRRGRCKVCVTQLAALIGAYRIPDFVTPNYIAESKNEGGLPYRGAREDVLQIYDYAAGARTLGIPLFVYTRVDTEVTPEFRAIVESTGGGIIPYFTVPNWSDPLDELAKQGLIAGTVMLVTGIMILYWGRIIITDEPAPQNTPIQSEEDFLRRAKERVRREIDKQDEKLKRL